MKEKLIIERQWFVYTLQDPRELGVVRYVGWTVDVSRRLRLHCIDDSRDQTNCGRWKRKLLKDGVLPVIFVVETGNGDGCKEAEKKWISFYRNQVGDRLTNVNSGGSGHIGHVVSAEVREKLRRSRLGKRASPETIRKLRGQKRCEAAREKMRKAHLGVPLSKEHAAAVAAAHRGLRRTEASKEKTRISLKKHYEQYGTRKLSKATKNKIRAALKRFHANKRLKAPL